MKKLLLTMAAALAVAFGASAISETPIYTFDYSNLSEMPQYGALSIGANLASETNAWSTYSQYADGDGIFLLSYNGKAQGNETFTTGLSKVSISEKVGTAFCVNGSSSKLSDTYSEATSHDYIGFYSLHWLVNPDVLTSVTAEYIRIRITFNAMSNSAALINSIELRQTNCILVNENAYNLGSKSYSDVFPIGFTDGHWAVYEVDVPNDGKLAYVSFKTPGSQGLNIGLLINKVEFIALTDKKDGDEYIESPQISYKDYNTEIALTGVVSSKVDIEDYKNKEITGSTDDYPAYYSQANAYNLDFTITPDASRVNAGVNSLEAKIQVLGTYGNPVGNTVTLTVPFEDNEPISCAIENLPYRATYFLVLESVKYAGDNEANNGSKVDANNEGTNPNKSEFTFTFDSQPTLYYYKTTDEQYWSVIFNNSVTPNGQEYELVGYASFSVKAYEADSDDASATVDVGVLSSPFGFDADKKGYIDYDYGLNGYSHRKYDEEYVDEIHNWAKIAYSKGSIPIHIANINDYEKIETTLEIEFPTITAKEMQVKLGKAATTGSVSVENLYFKDFNAKTEVSTYSTLSDALKDAQTSVANIAVEGNGKVEYFNLQGVSVDADALTPGLYIRRAGGKASKVIVK